VAVCHALLQEDSIERLFLHPSPISHSALSTTWAVRPLVMHGHGGDVVPRADIFFTFQSITGPTWCSIRRVVKGTMAGPGLAKCAPAHSGRMTDPKDTRRDWQLRCASLEVSRSAVLPQISYNATSGLAPHLPQSGWTKTPFLAKQKISVV
jgi:hypothetical protein